MTTDQAVWSIGRSLVMSRACRTENDDEAVVDEDEAERGGDG